MRPPLREPEPASDVSRLADIPFTSWYGHHLNDQQRVDRFNDLRALQIQLESKFDDNEAINLNRFLEKEKVRRTTQEAMDFYEKRMDTIDLDFLYA